MKLAFQASRVMKKQNRRDFISMDELEIAEGYEDITFLELLAESEEVDLEELLLCADEQELFE